MKLLRWIFVLSFSLQTILGFGQWSEFELEYPRAHQVLSDSLVHFSWNDTSAIKRLEVSTDSNFSLLLMDTILNVNEFELSMSHCQTYYWKVSSTTQSRQSQFSLFKPSCISSLRIHLEPENYDTLNEVAINPMDTAYNFSANTDLGVSNSGVLNNQSVFDFTGNKFLVSQSGDSIMQPYEVSFLLRDDPSRLFYFFDTPNSISDRTFILRTGGGMRYDAGGSISFSPPSNSTQFLNLNYQINGVSSKIHYNDSVVLIGNQGNIPIKDLILGSGRFFFPYSDILSEFIVFDDTLSALQRSQFYAYQRDKYYPNIFLGNDRLVCDSSLTLTINDEAYHNILWSTGDTTGSITITQDGEYWVSAQNIFDEPTTDTIQLRGFRTPIVLEFNADTTLCLGSSLSLNTTFSDVEYQNDWSNGLDSASVTLNSPGEYWVEVSDTFGCFAVSDTARIEVDSFSNKVALPH